LTELWTNLATIAQTSLFHSIQEQSHETMNTNPSTALLRKLPRLSGNTAWLLGWLLLAAWFGCGREWLKHNPAPAQAAFRPRPSALASQPKLEAVAISQMRVGDQVPADNPTGEKDTEFGDTVDPPNWRKLVLLAPKKDGSTADVELLRPLWWLEEQQAEVGGTVDIQVPECGIEGRAEVLAIEPCPPIKPRPGLRVVTGTFKHRASQVLDVYVEGLDEPIGTTPNHPFWSEDRQTFVRADELNEGEHLRAFNGTPIVRRVVPLADPEPVFNLEVQCDHVYHVAKNGVLVHNSDPCPRIVMQIVENVMARSAGFADDGARIIIDSNVSVRGLADALRQRGYNVRTVQEISGADPGDRVIREVAERLGARVLSNDRGRILGEGFPHLGIFVPQGLRNPDTYARIIDTALLALTH
jgi:hypothetical protein